MDLSITHNKQAAIQERRRSSDICEVSHRSFLSSQSTLIINRSKPEETVGRLTMNDQGGFYSHHEGLSEAFARNPITGRIRTTKNTKKQSRRAGVRQPPDSFLLQILRTARRNQTLVLRRGDQSCSHASQCLRDSVRDQFFDRTVTITRRRPSDFDFRKRSIRRSGALCC